MDKSMILGIDMGNYNYKDNFEILIPARLTKKENILGHNPDKIIYENEKFYIGEGELEIDLNKTKKDSNDILMLAMLNNYPCTFFKLVTGLPIQYYIASKDEFREKILEKKIYDFEFNGVKKRKIIEDLFVFPEGAGAYFSIEQKDRPKDAIMIDIGGKTCNIVSFTNGILDNNFSTIGDGMIDCYSLIRDNLNQRYVLNLSVEEIEKVLKNGLKVDGEPVDLSFANYILSEYISKILNEVRLNFEYRLKPIFVCGGGAEIIGNDIVRKLKNSRILRKSIFANAKGFYKVGCSKWD